MHPGHHMCPYTCRIVQTCVRPPTSALSRAKEPTAPRGRPHAETPLTAAASRLTGRGEAGGRQNGTFGPLLDAGPHARPARVRTSQKAERASPSHCVGHANSSAAAGFTLCASGENDFGEEPFSANPPRRSRGGDSVAVSHLCELRVGELHIFTRGTPCSVSTVASGGEAAHTCLSSVRWFLCAFPLQLRTH